MYTLSLFTILFWLVSLLILFFFATFQRFPTGGFLGFLWSVSITGSIILSIALIYNLLDPDPIEYEEAPIEMVYFDDEVSEEGYITALRDNFFQLNHELIYSGRSNLAYSPDEIFQMPVDEILAQVSKIFKEHQPGDVEGFIQSALVRQRLYCMGYMETICGGEEERERTLDELLNSFVYGAGYTGDKQFWERSKQDKIRYLFNNEKHLLYRTEYFPNASNFDNADAFIEAAHQSVKRRCERQQNFCISQIKMFNPDDG